MHHNRHASIKYLILAGIIIALFVVFSLVIYANRTVSDYTIFLIHIDGEVRGLDVKNTHYPLVSKLLLNIPGVKDKEKDEDPLMVMTLPREIVNEMAIYMKSHSGDICQCGCGFIDRSKKNVHLRAIMAYGPNPDVARGWEIKDGVVTSLDFQDNTKAIQWASWASYVMANR